MHFGQSAKIRLTAYTGVASSLLGFGARTVCSMFKTGTTKFKEAGITTHIFVMLISKVINCHKLS